MVVMRQRNSEAQDSLAESEAMVRCTVKEQSQPSVLAERCITKLTVSCHGIVDINLTDTPPPKVESTDKSGDVSTASTYVLQDTCKSDQKKYTAIAELRSVSASRKLHHDNIKQRQPAGPTTPGNKTCPTQPWELCSRLTKGLGICPTSERSIYMLHSPFSTCRVMV